MQPALKTSGSNAQWKWGSQKIESTKGFTSEYFDFQSLKSRSHWHTFLMQQGDTRIDE